MTQTEHDYIGASELMQQRLEKHGIADLVLKIGEKIECSNARAETEEVLIRWLTSRVDAGLLFGLASQNLIGDREDEGREVSLASPDDDLFEIKDWAVFSTPAEWSEAQIYAAWVRDGEDQKDQKDQNDKLRIEALF